jgi:L-alanine-DL-glutamate epimerase-like enolase superfamily enzyme
MKIAAVDLFTVNVPQKHPIAPYQSRYRATSSTHKLLVCLTADDGTEGWGETPQPYLGESLDPNTMAAGLREQLLGKDPTLIAAIYSDWKLGGDFVQSAVEMAMWDILGKVCRQPVYRLLGGLYRKEIELAACMGIRPPAEAAEIARWTVEQGFTTLKFKGGRDPEEDRTTVRTLREAVGDRLRLRLDANTGYAPEVCLPLARDLEPYNLEYFEQPMPQDRIEESAAFRSQTATPLALNESVTSLNVVRRILDLNAAAVLLPDTYQCGGIRAVKEVLDLAAASGVPCVMHCAHDLGPKTAAMLHLAASSPNVSLANDCTYYGLVDDVIDPLFTIRRGRMEVPQSPGLGINVDRGKLQRYVA